MRRFTCRRVVGLVVAGGLLLSACGSGDADDEADAPEVDELSSVPDPMESLSEPPPGQGIAVLGIEELSFTVTACTQGPRPDDTPSASLDYLVEGAGATSEGPFTVEINRFRSESDVTDPLITETVTISFGAGEDVRGVQAKRTTAGPDGAWLDLIDPVADEPLIERRGDAYDVRATFGPEAARLGDDGLQEGRLRVRCPS